MSAVVTVLIALAFLFVGLVVAYTALVVMEVVARERRRRAALVRAQQAEARIHAASAQAVQQMLQVARQVQNTDRP
ncbi:hypothetical protein [Raineyella sp. W15-4]|uniref:hypothetical protein n=1 Tax=Raineyella sp. W15-4 TaxID=3081651 RepID=UPI002955B686|nr:hypothetical protein [Raineyella sp. W15-4]WOQ17595.1 hypothetical protein R0145_02465 [Raineyella sp. W15-4]